MVWSLVLTLKRRGSDVFSNDPYHHSWGKGGSCRFLDYEEIVARMLEMAALKTSSCLKISQIIDNFPQNLARMHGENWDHT